jgi:Cu(I)/Ag(I) efflux system membrane fusion protein
MMKKNKITRIQIIFALVALIAGLFLGWLLFGGYDRQAESESISGNDLAEETVWTCSMHPQIRQPESGDCPICGMDLIPLEEDHGGELEPGAIVMSPTAMQLAQVSTVRAGTIEPVKSIRLDGKVRTDERLVFSQSSHIPGRIEELSVDFTGEYVQQSQILAKLYSPELVTAQEELFEARKMRDSQPGIFNAAIEKLKRWKLTGEQINEILAAGEALENFNIRADVSGFVAQKFVNKGDYIDRGEPIYEIAGLSKVWVLFDVYESDLPWVKKGDEINFSVPSIPGKNFQAEISYIDPVIDPKTRVARARVEVSNTNLQLKPEMFASGIVESGLDTDDEPLFIPKSSVMWTGERSIVYVKKTTDQGVSFKMREVTLGPSLGRGYIVREGLSPDDEIAVNGTFSIDAAAQLAGKPSMMNPRGGKVTLAHDHSGHVTAIGAMENMEMKAQKDEYSAPMEFKEQLTLFYKDYLIMKNHFVETAPLEVKKSAAEALKSLEDINMGLLSGEAHNFYMEHFKGLRNSLTVISESEDIEIQRKAFSDLNDHFTELIKTFGLEGVTSYYQYCPMANQDEGAYWFSEISEIRNPYFGDEMLMCGETRDTIR